MSKEVQQQMDTMINGILETVYLKYLRPFKRQLLKCCIDCLDQNNLPRESDKCMISCDKNTSEAMNVIQRELGAFQGRINRCLIDCHDGARYQKDQQEATRTFNQCAERCVNKFIPIAGDVTNAICDELEKLKAETDF